MTSKHQKDELVGQCKSHPLLKTEAAKDVAAKGNITSRRTDSTFVSSASYRTEGD